MNKEQWKVEEEQRLASITSKPCNYCGKAALKLTGACRYSSPLQYEYKCQECQKTGHLHGVSQLADSNLFTGSMPK